MPERDDKSESQLLATECRDCAQSAKAAVIAWIADDLVRLGGKFQPFLAEAVNSEPQLN